MAVKILGHKQRGHYKLRYTLSITADGYSDGDIASRQLTKGEN